MQLTFVTLILSFVPWTTEITISNNNVLEKEYAKALELSLLFFEAQRSGELPWNNRIRWRGNAALWDLTPDGFDVTGGYYNSGVNFVKSAYPTAFTMTMLAWGVLLWSEAYKQAGQLTEVFIALKWGADYFMKCNINKTRFVVQVGNITYENKIWGRPEDLYYDRTILEANEAHPATDITAEVAAALAAASIVFKDIFFFNEYSQKCLDHAKDLYDFASVNPKSLCDVVDCDSNITYKYSDELVWASLWLYRATNHHRILRNARTIYKTFTVFKQYKFVSYHNKGVAVEMLFAELTGRSYFFNIVKRFCDSLLTDTYRFTEKGLLYVSNRHTLSVAANAAFICLVAARYDYFKNASEYNTFAKKQINYMLGIGTGRSYVVGYGENPPTQPCHKAASCRSLPNPCGWQQAIEDKPNPHILYGALVAGPYYNEYFEDVRLSNNSMMFFTEVNIEYNAGFTGALAGLLQLERGKRYQCLEKCLTMCL